MNLPANYWYDGTFFKYSFLMIAWLKFIKDSE